VRDFLSARGQDTPDWSEWCYVPMAGAYAIVSGGGALPKWKRADISRVAAVAAWRPTRTIVQIGPARLQSLWEGEIPEEVGAGDLSSLPVWGPYVDLQDIDVQDKVGVPAEGAISHRCLRTRGDRPHAHRRAIASPPEIKISAPCKADQSTPTPPHLPARATRAHSARQQAIVLTRTGTG